jgi:hypothetical protein
MNYKINVILFDKLIRNYPGTGKNNFINPLKMLNDLYSLVVGLETVALVAVDVRFGAHAHYQVHVLEFLLCLLDLVRVSDVQAVVATVRVDTNRVLWA